MAWDRSGHRFAGPAISNGAKIFDAKGELVLDDGYKTTVTKFVDWNKDGTMLKEVWGGVGRLDLSRTRSASSRTAGS